MKPPATLKLAETKTELEQILLLQDQNLVQHVSPENRGSNGFVTVKHDLELLTKMNLSAKQIIAIDESQVVGYALVLLKEFSRMIPVLEPMFEMFQTLSFKQQPLEHFSYYVMGQICIADTHRGSGLFERLYLKHKEIYAKKFELCLTEVSSSNPRSMKAHEKIGFKKIHHFDDKTDNWNILVWDWN